MRIAANSWLIFSDSSRSNLGERRNNTYHADESIMSSLDVIKRLLAEGWLQVRSRGSHRQFRHSIQPGLVTVQHPKRDLPKGTLKSIFKQAGWSE